jgi:phosphoribosylglycinamide formyltransferase-1
VVSNHESGGVRKRADRLGVPFLHFPKPWAGEEYKRLAQDTGAEFFALSGWLKRVVGLDPSRTFNIHPGPVPEFGGDGMYGHHVHEAVMAAHHRGEVTHSAVCMHFTIPAYDRGPLFFRFNVKIREDDTPDSLGDRVNKWEHYWQPQITNLVVHREIYWDGINPYSLRFPQRYDIHRYE